MKNEKNKPNLFSNNFGTITSDEIHIHSFDIKIPLLFKYIKYFLLLLSVFMFWMMLHNNIFFVSNTILGTSGIALLAAGVFYRTSERQFIIFTRFDFIKIEVEASLEEDSKKFIKEFNKYHD
jgi:hypothetical protein